MTGNPSSEYDLFDDEIDLRKYLRILFKHWQWILIITVLAALSAAGVSQFILPPTYEATALVTITLPKYLMEFSPEFRAVAQDRLVTEISKTYPELAKSDELLAQVSDTLEQTASQRIDISRGRMSVEASKTVGIIRLTVQDRDPAKATTIVNTWAEHYVQMLKRLYGGEEGEYSFFDDQLAQARADVEAAQEALAEFKGRDPALLLSSELDAKEDALKDYLATRNTIEVLQQEIEGWRKQLATQPDGRNASASDELTALLLQLEAFGLFRDNAPAQFQIPLEGIAEGQTVADQIASLDRLEGWLQTRRDEIKVEAENLEPQVLSLQYDLQQAENEWDRLNRDARVAKSLHESLSLKTEQARITSESQQGVSRLASRASTPSEPVSPRKLVNTAVGAVLGLAVGLLLVVFLELFDRSRSAPESGSSTDAS